MKKLIITLIIITSALTALSAESAKDIIDRMDEVMDFETLSFSATMKNTDRLGTTVQSFSAGQNRDGDTLMTVTAGLDK